MNQVRLVADSSCDLLTLSGTDFVSVPLTIRTETEEFRDDAALDVDEMVRALRDTNGRSYSACPNVADWEEAFGERRRDRIYHYKWTLRQLRRCLRGKRKL